MAVVREVLAAFSVLVDDRPLSRLDKRINRVKDNIGRWSAMAVGGAATAGYAMFQLAEQASSAEETIAGIGEVFKENRQAALDWADSTAKSMQRSGTTLKKSVFDFGKFLRPTFEGTNTDILAMSENLTKLAVDLASFNDTTFEEASTRLFSGMTGETEAVRRLGINISDEALKSLAQESGDNRAIAKMSLAEKTQLRYIKILRDSRDAQGDAMRSAARWAGQLERAKGMVTELGVKLGQVSMKIMLPALQALQDATDGLAETWAWLEEKTSTLRTAFMMLGVGIGVHYTAALVAATQANWGLITAIAWSIKVMLIQQGLLAKVALQAGVAAAAFLAVEDALTFSRGGESVLGDIIKWITGTADALEWANEKAEIFFGTLAGEGDAVRKRIADRHSRQKEERDRAVATGDAEGFMLHKGKDMSHAQAQQQFLKQRQELVRRDPSKATQTDVDSGLLTQDALRQAQVLQKVQRKDQLKKNPMAVTQEDVDAGLASKNQLDKAGKFRAKQTKLAEDRLAAVGGQKAALNTVGSQAGLTPFASFAPTAPVAPAGNKQVVNNVTITVDGSKNSEEAAKKVYEVMMRLDYAGDGEEQ
jgi:hypothetical protein